MKKLPSLALAAITGLSACTSSTPAHTAKPSPAPEEEALPSLEVERYQLENGLEVILQPDHRLPLVAVNIWYHVGAIDEQPGRTGFAHLFEHMMFQGSPHVGEDQHFKLLQQIGASGVNGTTSFDRTNYFETVPAQELETALWLESDRMGFLLSSLTNKSLQNQIAVVTNERRQSYDMRPYGLAQERITQLLYPAPHPYNGDVIGSMEDVSAASIADVRAFFKKFYTPANATLTLAGDFQPSKAKAMIQRYFGSLKGAAKPSRPKIAQPKLGAPIAVDFDEPIGKLPRLFVVWPIPPAFSADEPALELLAHVISGTRSARLDKKVSFEDRLAESVTAYTDTNEGGGRFVIDLTTQPGRTAEEALLAVDAVLDELKRRPPTEAELSRAKNAAEARLVRGLERLGSRADRLQAYNHYLGDPQALGKELQEIRALTVADLVRAQARYLGRLRIVMKAVPKAGATPPKAVAKKAPAQPAGAEEAPPPVPASEAWRRARPQPREARAPVLPRFKRSTLDNGLTVLVAEQHQLPLLSISLVTRGGSAMDPKGEAGLGAMVYDMLEQGAGPYDALAFSDRVADLGARLSSGVGKESGGVGISGLSQNASAMLELLSLAVRAPALKAEDFERARQARVSSLTRDLSAAFGKASAALPAILFGAEHPFGHPSQGQPSELKALSLAQLKEGAARLLAPEHSALVIVGDIKKKEAIRLAETRFGGWARGQTPRPKIPPVAAKPRKQIYAIDQRPAAQTLSLIGRPLFGRGHPEELALSLANEIYGGSFNSRINMNLREDKGYTYGAHSIALFWGKLGVFEAYAGVKQDATAASLKELFSELSGLKTRPFTAEEVKDAKDGLVRSLTGSFEGISAVGQAAGELFVYDLPLNYYKSRAEQMSETTAEQIQTAAGLMLSPDFMQVLLVGEIPAFSASVEALKLGPVQRLRLNTAP